MLQKQTNLINKKIAKYINKQIKFLNTKKNLKMRNIFIFKN